MGEGSAQKKRWVSRRPWIVLCAIPGWMGSKRGSSGRWVVINSSPTGGRLREPPLLSNDVRVCKHKVETSKYGECRGDPSRFNVTTASYSNKRYEDQ